MKGQQPSAPLPTKRRPGLQEDSSVGRSNDKPNVDRMHVTEERNRHERRANNNDQGEEIVADKIIPTSIGNPKKNYRFHRNMLEEEKYEEGHIISIDEDETTQPGAFPVRTQRSSSNREEGGIPSQQRTRDTGNGDAASQPVDAPISVVRATAVDENQYRHEIQREIMGNAAQAHVVRTEEGQEEGKGSEEQDNRNHRPRMILAIIACIILVLVVAFVVVITLLATSNNKQESGVSNIAETPNEMPGSSTNENTTARPTLRPTTNKETLEPTLVPSVGPTQSPTTNTPSSSGCVSTLYGIALFGDFYRIDKENGNLTLVGNTGIGLAYGGAVDSAGRFLVMTRDDPTRLYQINPETASSSVFVAVTGIPSDHGIVSMSIDSSDNLYVVAGFGSSNNHRDIYRIDYLGRGEATEVTAEVVGFLQGCAFDTRNDDLYCVDSSNSLVLVDPSNGEKTFVSPMGDSYDNAVEYDPCEHRLWAAYSGIGRYDLTYRVFVPIEPTFDEVWLFGLFVATSESPGISRY